MRTNSHIVGLSVGSIAGTVLFLGAVLATNTTADATPTTATVTPSICQTGHRGDAAYDRACLRTGTVGDAAKLWFSTPEGKPGHETPDFQTRRSICAYPGKAGVRGRAKDLANDMAFDTYRNYGQVLNRVADMAQGECLKWGYADDRSGMVGVNLKTLPNRDHCWVEADRKHGKIHTEVICKF